jgi:hypothetical protein
MKNNSLIKSIMPSLNMFKKDGDDNKINGRIDEVNKNIVRGWASSKVIAESLWIKVTKGDVVQVVLADQERIDVMRAGLSDTPYCGYRVIFAEDNLEPVKVEVLLPVKKLGNTAISYANRNVFFMHIPKTAGSSVNELFKRELNEFGVYSHIEGLRDRWPEICNARVLSGHIRLVEYDDKLAESNRIIVSFFREPYRHLESHLNWVRHLSEPDKTEFLSGHPNIVAKISNELSKMDFSSPEVLGDYTKTLTVPAFGLFDNPQVRFLSSVAFNERVTAEHLNEALKNLDRVKILGLAEAMDDSFYALKVLLNLNDSKETIHANGASYRYGIDFKCAAARTAVNELVVYDLELYAEVEKRFSVQRLHINETRG